MTPPRARPWIAGLSRTPPSSWPRVAAPARTDSVLAGTRHSAIREPPGSPALAAWRGRSGACAALGIWHWRASAGSRATSPSIFGLVRRFHARLLDLQPPPRPAALCTRSTDQASIEATSLAPFHCRQLPGLLHSRSPPPCRRLPKTGPWFHPQRPRHRSTSPLETELVRLHLLLVEVVYALLTSFAAAIRSAAAALDPPAVSAFVTPNAATWPGWRCGSNGGRTLKL